MIHRLQRNGRDIIAMLERHISVSIEAGHEHSIAILDVDFGVHGARGFLHVDREARNLPRKRLVQ